LFTLPGGRPRERVVGSSTAAAVYLYDPGDVPRSGCRATYDPGDVPRGGCRATYDRGVGTRSGCRGVDNRGGYAPAGETCIPASGVKNLSDELPYNSPGRGVDDVDGD
jgi:hypothetical protein